MYFKSHHIAITLLILVVMLVTPVYIAHAQFSGPLVPCGIDENDDGKVTGPGAVGKDGASLPDEQCHFEDLIKIVQNVVNWLLAFAVFFAVILFSFAGFLYVTSAGDPGKLSKAHSMFRSVIIGFLIAMAAWLIINTILLGLGVDSAFILLKR